MKALSLVVSDKKIFENCILKTYFLTPWPTYATKWNDLNNFDRGPHRDHSCEVWSKSNAWFQRRCCLKKLLTHGRTDDGRRTMGHHKSSPWALCAHLEHFVLKWAKKNCKQNVNEEGLAFLLKIYLFRLESISVRLHCYGNGVIIKTLLNICKK